MFTITKRLADWNEAAIDPALTLGQKYVEESSGSRYMYVKFVDSAFADGAGCVWSTAAGAVTKSGTTEANVNLLAGICIGAKTQNYYGWILTDGFYDEVLVIGAAVAIGDELGFHTTAGQFMEVTAVRGGRIIAQEAGAAAVSNIRCHVRCGG